MFDWINRVPIPWITKGNMMVFSQYECDITPPPHSGWKDSFDDSKKALYLLITGQNMAANYDDDHHRKENKMIPVYYLIKFVKDTCVYSKYY